MRERLPTLTAMLLLLVLVIGTWWAAHYTWSTIEIDPPRRQTHEPDAWAQQFHMLRTDEMGIAINRLEGETMLHYPDDDSYHLDQAVVVVNQPQSPLLQAHADQAIMDEGGNRIQMIHNARIHREADDQGNPFAIYSHWLELRPNQDTIHTTEPAVVLDGPRTLTGTGMDYDNHSRQLQVHQDAQLILTPTTATPAHE